VTAARRTVVQGGREKAYRPIPRAQRRRALAEGLAAYDRGDYFLAHELLEPAWMGTDDLGEREVLQGLIKLSAAFVHAARGNRLGVAKNLRGGAARLATPEAAPAGRELAIDAPELLRRMEDQLAVIERDAGTDRGAATPLLPIPISRVGRSG
jgi:predicted metal-dependent hydrolase